MQKIAFWCFALEGFEGVDILNGVLTIEKQIGWLSFYVSIL